MRRACRRETSLDTPPPGPAAFAIGAALVGAAISAAETAVTSLAESRLQAATPAELETLADRVLDASSFDDLFGA